MRRALTEAALRAAAAAAAASAPASSSSGSLLRGGGTRALVTSSSVSSIDAASAAMIFARASSSAAASSSASVAVSAAEAEPRRSSRSKSGSGEKPARQPRRRSDGASSNSGGGSGGGGGRTNRGRGNDDGFSGSSSSSRSSSAPVSFDQYGDAIPPAVTNHAGEGAPGWQLLGEEPEISANFWALDAAGGRAGGAPEFAALLSSDAKDAMWAAYKGRGLSTSAIAKIFGVREQRAVAILALRAAEEEMGPERARANEEVALLFEGGVDGRGAVRAALDAAAARVALVERKRLEGIGQAPAPAEAEGEEGEEGEGEKKLEKDEEAGKSAAESLADEADAEVAAELSADAAAGAALRHVPSSPAPPPPSGSSLAAGAVVEVVQGVWPCDRLRGGGEAAVAPLPRYPAFELLLSPPGEGGGQGEKGKSGRRGGRRPAAAAVPANEEAPAESEVPAAERARALEAERAAVREFKSRLAFNAGSPAAARAALGLGRGKESDGPPSASSSSPPVAAAVVVAAARSVSRAAVAPRRPEGGWPLLVVPLSSSPAKKGKGGRPAREKPFVASPDGTRRPLSAEEKAALKRATPLPRKRGVVS